MSGHVCALVAEQRFQLVVVERVRAIGWQDDERPQNAKDRGRFGDRRSHEVDRVTDTDSFSCSIECRHLARRGRQRCADRGGDGAQAGDDHHHDEQRADRGREDDDPVERRRRRRGRYEAASAISRTIDDTTTCSASA